MNPILKLSGLFVLAASSFILVEYIERKPESKTVEKNTSTTERFLFSSFLFFKRPFTSV